MHHDRDQLVVVHRHFTLPLETSIQKLPFLANMFGVAQAVIFLVTLYTMASLILCLKIRLQGSDPILAYFLCLFAVFWIFLFQEGCLKASTLFATPTIKNLFSFYASNDFAITALFMAQFYVFGSYMILEALSTDIYHGILAKHALPFIVCSFYLKTKMPTYQYLLVSGSLFFSYYSLKDYGQRAELFATFTESKLADNNNLLPLIIGAFLLFLSKFILSFFVAVMHHHPELLETPLAVFWGQ